MSFLLKKYIKQNSCYYFKMRIVEYSGRCVFNIKKSIPMLKKQNRPLESKYKIDEINAHSHRNENKNGNENDQTKQHQN